MTLDEFTIEAQKVRDGMSEEERRESWDISMGMAKLSGGEPDEFFLGLVEKEIRGEIKKIDMLEILVSHYTVEE